jgi:hypothetical protein
MITGVSVETETDHLRNYRHETLLLKSTCAVDEHMRCDVT